MAVNIMIGTTKFTDGKNLSTVS